MPERAWKYATISALVAVVLLLLALMMMPGKRSLLPAPSPLSQILSGPVAQGVLDDGYNVYWASARETYTEFTPTLTLVHQFQVRVGDAPVYTETISAEYEWYELEYLENGTLAQFSYAWPSTPGLRYVRTFWRVDAPTFDEFVEQHGDDLACGPLMLCIYELDGDGNPVPSVGGWYEAGHTGYRFYLPVVGGQ
jgi:hypothetical protein